MLDNISACAPIQVQVQTEYGNARLLVSNVNAFPEWDDRLNNNGNVANGYVASDPTYHYSQASLTLCPSPLFDQGYEFAPGIYSVGVHALENTAFRLQIRFFFLFFFFLFFPELFVFIFLLIFYFFFLSVGLQHPIPQPAERVSCDDVPEIEFEVARGEEGSIHDVLCLEDRFLDLFFSPFSVLFLFLFLFLFLKPFLSKKKKNSITKVVHLDYPVVDLSNQVILPFPAGCHVATFTATGVLYGRRNEYEPVDVYCFPTIENDLVKINTSSIGRFVPFFFLCVFFLFFLFCFFVSFFFFFFFSFSDCFFFFFFEQPQKRP